MKQVNKILAFVLMLVLLMSTLSFAFTESNDFEGQLQAQGLNYDVKIQGSGDTVVVLESGYGDTYGVWDSVVSQLDLTKYTVFMYNRAGLGTSEVDADSGDINQTAKVLNKLLKKAKLENKPTIFVAHSYGALIARIYAENYGTDVKGVVLVDGSHELQEQLMASFIPEEYLEMYYAQFAAEASYAQILLNCDIVANSRDGFEGKELSVLTASQHGLGPDGELQWQELQSDHATLSDKSVWMLIESSHYIHQEVPSVVVSEIERIYLAIQ